MKELSKAYSPQEVEDKIYKLWEESGAFSPSGDGKPFTILMPPTNANGNLHAGHGLVMTIEDIMIRYKRMQGFKTLWLPGTDHAGFETQVVYEKKLEKEGRSRFGMEGQQLYDEIMDFTLTNKKNIISQVKKMGASCDWSREKFTLDPDIIKTVYDTFKKLHKDKLLYRGKRIISWCTKHQTSFSDLEIKDEERVEPYYYLKYGPFIISTSRPETKFGDKYVTMHPDDKRYLQYKDGDKIELEWINGPLTATVIKDSAVDMAFGTGAMTITPWHDTADFEIAERHGLEKEQVIDWRGKLLPIAGEFAGMKITEAREKIVAKLQSKGLVDHIEEKYKHTVKTCYKCGTVIEPQIKDQWFVKMKPLAEKLIPKIESDEVKFIPEHYKKIVLHWLNNIIDWNISRQIVWGIPIPAWQKGDEWKISETSPGEDWTKDPDTFDTWFSSSQWPFAALQGKDFETFYPTDVMETAGEIIFFWVARMMMLGQYVTGKLPFSTVYLHGLVLDAKGQKMSKSKGNVINPLDFTEKFGTDAFRMGLVVGNTPGTSLALAEDKVKAYKHFANKLWNVGRYIIGRMQNEKIKMESEFENEQIQKTRDLIKEVTSDMDEYKFYLAAEKLYHFAWHDFADKYIESTKDKSDPETFFTLIFTFSTLLRLLHPFMPFVTEELWGQLPSWEGKKLLILEEWPSYPSHSS